MLGAALGPAGAAGGVWLTSITNSARLFRHVGRNEPSKRTPSDFAWVHRELCKVAVTPQLLWLEYTDAAGTRADGSRPYGGFPFYHRADGGVAAFAVCVACGDRIEAWRERLLPIRDACGDEELMRSHHAALEYRWCRPPTRGSATMSPAFGGSTGVARSGASPRRVLS